MKAGSATWMDNIYIHFNYGKHFNMNFHRFHTFSYISTMETIFFMNFHRFHLLHK